MNVSATMFVTILQEVRVQQWSSKLLFLCFLSFAVLPLVFVTAHKSPAIINKEVLEKTAKIHLHEQQLDDPHLFTQKLHNPNDGIESTIKNNNTLIMEDTSKTVTIFYAFISATLVGLSGIVPLIVFPLANIKSSSNGAVHQGKTLHRLLSFAVGSMLGDVFLHLLPESWEQINSYHHHHSHQDGVTNGVWIMLGLVGFCLLEKCFPDDADDNTESPDCGKDSKYSSNNNRCDSTAASSCDSNEIYHERPTATTTSSTTQSSIKASGYLNLLANCIDNLVHGLAVGGAYLVCKRQGMLTTLAILLHEIPHEIGDFAILLRAGFDKWHAAKMQLITASGSVIGALSAFVSAEFAGQQVSWILPFTSGGFIYIALCQVVPDILNKQESPKESLLQVGLIVSAVMVMHFVSHI